jgi:hypothetical protein
MRTLCMSVWLISITLPMAGVYLLTRRPHPPTLHPVGLPQTFMHVRPRVWWEGLKT